MSDKATSKTVGQGITVKISVDEAYAVTWPDVASAALTTILPLYPYLTVLDILDHLNSEWEYRRLREKAEEDNAVLDQEPEVPASEA